MSVEEGSPPGPALRRWKRRALMSSEVIETDESKPVAEGSEEHRRITVLEEELTGVTRLVPLLDVKLGGGNPPRATSSFRDKDVVSSFEGDPR